MIVGTVLGTIAIVLVVVVVGVLIDRKRALLPKPAELAEASEKKKPGAHGLGEAPVTAIRARPAQIAKLRIQRCTRCRAELAAGPDDTVRYNDRALLVLHFTCERCGSKRSLYIAPV